MEKTFDFENLSYNNRIREIVTIAQADDKEAARAYIEQYADYLMTLGEMTREEAIETAKSNIGYLSGYVSMGMVAKVNEVFGAAHPIFG